MASEAAQLLGQRLSEKYDITVDKLEPGYISKCTNIKELEKILRILRSGEEGVYQHVEEICEKRIYSLNPKSRSLRKEERLTSTKELPKDSKDSIMDDLKNWTNEMKSRDESSATGGRSSTHVEGGENLPPIRGHNLQSFTQKTPSADAQPRKGKSAKPRDYKEWDKIIHEMDEKEEDSDADSPRVQDTNVVNRKGPKALVNQLKVDGLSTMEKEQLANREKDKGNEAFRSGDFHEALTYYNRSLSVMSVTATYNNRALAYVRMGKWTEAVTDCNTVLETEPDNVKAKLRRAVAYKSLRRFKLAKNDLDFVLEVEPNNKRAKDILKEIKPELEKDEERKAQGKGHRMVIEETDGESDAEEVEMPKPVTHVNGDVPQPTQTIPNGQSTEQMDQDRTKSRRVVVEETDSDSDDEFEIAKESMEQVPPMETGKQRTPFESEKQATIQEPPKQSVSIQSEEPSSSGSNSSQNTSEDSTPNTSPRNSSLYNIIKKNVEATSTSSMASDAPQQKSGDVHSKVLLEPNTNSCGTSAQNNEAESVEIQEQTTPSISEATEGDEQADVIPTQEVIKVPSLPPKVNTLKQKGNALFKNGQYGEAVKFYTQAIKILESDRSHAYNVGTLYNNRAACYLKTGETRAACADCTTALELTPHNSKALLRRAAAYEAREKYMDAYVDYRHVLNMEPQAENARAGSNRCQNILSSEHGPNWRTRMPKVPSTYNIPKYQLEESGDKLSNQTPAIAAQAISKDITTKPASPGSVKETDDEMFDRLKAAGNKMVGKGDFVNAIDQYTQAIALFPDRPVPYSNRALCYLKQDEATLALKDCNEVLSVESNHVKALFRRAQAHRMLKQYKESLADLVVLAKLDPNEKSVKKELDLVKKEYREQLESLKTAAQPKEQATAKTGTKPAADAKPAKRVVIEEGSSDEAEPAKPASRRQKKNKSKHKQKKASARDTPVTTPTLSENATAYEFTSAWTALRKCANNKPYADLIRQIPPTRMASVLSNKLEADMLERIVSCFDEQFTDDELQVVQQYLKSISTVPRFSMTTMLMSANSKSNLRRLLQRMEKAGIATVDQLSLAYGV